jgi:hypothetical protein
VPANLGAIARAMFDRLVQLGATEFRVRYDGGYDEGFSHPDAVQLPAGLRDAKDVAADLAKDASLVDAIRAAASGLGSMYGNATDVYGRADDPQVIRYALDELAHELASRLLGDGYGTGEYRLYGAFRAELQTGKLIDDPDAAKPTDLMD